MEIIFEGVGIDVCVNVLVDCMFGFECILLGWVFDFWNEEVYELCGLELI